MALELCLVVGRVVSLLFSAAAFTVMIKAPNMNNFTSFLFLTIASCVQMAWSAIRLLFQVACLWFGRAQPTTRTLIVLVILELALASMTMAAGWSALGVTILLDLDINDCSYFSPLACPMYLIASTFAIIVGVDGILIELGMQWVLAFRYYFNTTST